MALYYTLVRDSKMTFRVIFDQWPKLYLGLDALSNQKILNGIYYLPGTLEVGDRIGGSFLRWWTKDEADL